MLPGDLLHDAGCVVSLCIPRVEVFRTDHCGRPKLPCMYLAHHELDIMISARDVGMCSAMQCSLVTSLLGTLAAVVQQQECGLQTLAGCRSESSEKP